MSTKIYEAYRIPVSRLGEWLEHFHNGCRDYIIERMCKCEVPEEEEVIFRSRRKGGGDKAEWSKEEISKCWGLWRWMVESKGGRVGAFNFDSSFNFWLYNGEAYIIPYWPCGMRVKVPDWCEGYEYWDNSDHPGNVNYEEWKDRGERWEELALKNWDKGRMSHVAFEGKSDYVGKVVGIGELIGVLSGGDEEVKDRIRCGVAEFKSVGGNK